MSESAVKFDRQAIYEWATKVEARATAAEARVAELEAADRAGLAGIFSDRPGNPGRDSGPFERINNYNQLKVNDDERRS